MGAARLATAWPRRLASRLVLAADTDLAVVFKHSKMHIGDRGAAGRPQGRFELMLGQSLAVHHVAIDMTIMNDDLWFALHKLFQTLVSEGRIADHPIQGDQGGRGNQTSDHGIVTAIHRILNGVAQYQEQNQIEGSKLADLTLAAHAQ